MINNPSLKWPKVSQGYLDQVRLTAPPVAAEEKDILTEIPAWDQRPISGREGYSQNREPEASKLPQDELSKEERGDLGPEGGGSQRPS